MGIWQDLVDGHGFRSSYQSVQRFVRKLRGAVSPEARVIIETKLGEEAQVDYGTGPMVRDPDSGKYRRTRLFVMTLGSSCKCVRLLAFRSSARVWAELHEKAFRRLGGSPRIVVLDNLREGVLSPDFYDPGLNPLYRDVLAHYGVTALPCKVRDPDRKGKVESGVAHAQKTPLKGKKFESLEEAQAYRRLIKEFGYTQRSLAKLVGHSQPHISRRLSLLDLPEKVRADLEPTDMLFMEFMLTSVAGYAEQVKPEIWRRYLALLTDALRPARDGTAPLPVPALVPDEMLAVMRSLSQRS